MNESQDLELTEFMRAVEKRASRVYFENNMDTYELVYMLTPVFVGFVASTILLFSYLDVAVEIDFLILLLALGLPLGMGILVMILVAFQLTLKAATYGVRGVSRNLLSVAIMFLDMLNEGHLHTGNIIEQPSLEEYDLYSSRGFSATNLVLKKLDPGSYEIFSQFLKEKKQASKALREKLFDYSVIFGFILIVGLIIAAFMLQSLNLISEDLTMMLLTFSTVVGILLVCIASVHLRRKSERGPSEELERTILEPDLKTETQLTLDRLLGTLISEAEHPLRVLTIGEHDLLTYTDHTYKTSKDIILREAVLIPKRFKR
ncbi:MAG: hypothetical protein ACFFDQ_13675 [Candidatus Thorarchaeota archaeon]